MARRPRTELTAHEIERVKRALADWRKLGDYVEILEARIERWEGIDPQEQADAELRHFANFAAPERAHAVDYFENVKDWMIQRLAAQRLEVLARLRRASEAYDPKFSDRFEYDGESVQERYEKGLDPMRVAAAHAALSPYLGAQADPSDPGFRKASALVQLAHPHGQLFREAPLKGDWSDPLAGIREPEHVLLRVLAVINDHRVAAALFRTDDREDDSRSGRAVACDKALAILFEMPEKERRIKDCRLLADGPGQDL